MNADNNDICDRCNSINSIITDYVYGEVVCNNCGKEIETYKMVLHERFCSQNVRKCSICNEPVQKDEYEEHKNLIQYMKMKLEQNL